MELKFYHLYDANTALCSSNRTFMELKFNDSLSTLLDSVVLIVPLWN